MNETHAFFYALPDRKAKISKSLEPGQTNAPGARRFAVDHKGKVNQAPEIGRKFFITDFDVAAQAFANQFIKHDNQRGIPAAETGRIDRNRADSAAAQSFKQAKLGVFVVKIEIIAAQGEFEFLLFQSKVERHLSGPISVFTVISYYAGVNCQV